MPFFKEKLNTHTHTQCPYPKGRNCSRTGNLIIFMVNGFQSKKKKRKISSRRAGEQVHHEISRTWLLRKQHSRFVKCTSELSLITEILINI